MKDNRKKVKDVGDFDWRDFFSDTKNLVMAIVIGVLVVGLLVAVLVTKHRQNKISDEDMVVTTTGVVQTDSKDSGVAVPVTVDSEMASAYSKSITNAKNLYQGKKVTIKAYPAYVGEEGSGLMFEMESPEDKSTVQFTIVPQDVTVKKQIMSLDPNNEVSVTGTVEDGSVDAGYQIIATDVKGVAKKSTTTKKASAESSVKDGTVVGTKKASDTTYTTNADSIITVAKSGDKYYLYADNHKMSNYSGLAHVSINGENGYYYFGHGVYRPNYNNIVEFNGNRYMVVSGQAKTNFTGKFILDGKSYHVTNGIIE